MTSGAASPRMESASPAAESLPLLAEDEPPPFERIEASGANLIFVCDHASRVVPRILGDLGLDDAELRRHIAWDIGAADVSRLLAGRFGGALALAGYSRLVVDCNRYTDDPQAFPEVSDDVPIFGNRSLPESAMRQRIDALYRPYHEAVAGLVAGFLAKKVIPAFLSIHSFTPVFKGFERPWQIGVLWDADPRIAVPLIEGLRRQAGLAVGDNQPYSAREPRGYTVREHAAEKGLPHLVVEIRQDLIDTDQGAAHWAQVLGDVLAPILDDPALYEAKRYG